MHSPTDIQIEVTWRARTRRRDGDLLERVARHAARATGFRTGTLSIAVVGDREMAELHWRFMKIRGPTDVLTFDLGTNRRARRLEGEIAVDPSEARRAVRKLGATVSPERLAAELALYVVHGVLHLAGYDDHDADDFRKMHLLEDQLLTKLGLGPVFAEERATAKRSRVRPTPYRR